DDETIAGIAEQLQELEHQKRVAEGLLYDVEDDDVQREEVEKELAKFEQWVELVRPFLTDENYTPTYEEKRLAVRILGIQVTVFPSIGDYPCRYRIDVTVPEIMKKLHCEHYQGWITGEIV